MISYISFVITGGPCGGKSTALERVKALGIQRGFNVIVIPEVARMFISAGMDPRPLKSSDNMMMQIHIAHTQLRLEDSARGFAIIHARNTGQRTLIICDRGLCDNGAYMDRATWRTVLSALNLNPATALARYDAVFHLQSAAVGAIDHYKNDPVRTDTPEQAANLDNLTAMQWDTHQRFYFIHNPRYGGFEGKMEILEEHIKSEL